MPDVDATATLGVEARGYRRGTTAADPWDQYVIPVQDRIITFDGRAGSFITPGRAGVRQVLATIHNAAGSTVLVSVDRLRVDMLQTGVAVAIGVFPPLIQMVRFAGAPTGGLAITKGSQDTALTSNASVVLTGDAASHNNVATTALAMTNGAVLGQVWGPRLVQATATAANAAVAELVDTAEFLNGEPDVILRAGEGLAITLDMATASTGNPGTNRWIATIDWSEYTRP